jgi:hypothetical protein
MKEDTNVAFVYGSVARSRELEHCDIDRMIVGRVGFGDVVESLDRCPEIAEKGDQPHRILSAGVRA